MQVEIWSDVICPWCYIGKRRFETAVASFGHPVEVTWRSFELDPGAPPVRAGSSVDHIALKYAMTAEEAAAGQRRITVLAAAEGLDYHLERTRSGRTFDAHRLLHLAGGHGLGDVLKERLLAGYLCEGVAIGLPEELSALALGVGLAPDQVDAVLGSDAFGDEVRADEARAAELGITGVPFFLIDGRFGLTGAQDPETIGRALERAWTDPVPVAGGGAEGASGT